MQLQNEFLKDTFFQLLCEFSIMAVGCFKCWVNGTGLMKRFTRGSDDPLLISSDEYYP